MTLKELEKRVEVLETEFALLKVRVTEIENEKTLRVENLSDSEALALSKLKMPAKQQKILHKLLEKNNEGELTSEESKQLDAMLVDYDDALLRKAQALRVAVERGLMKPLSSE